MDIAEKLPVKKAEFINRSSIQKKMKSYTKKPASMLLMILVVLSAVITVSVLAFLVIYILVKGVPNINLKLFEWKYTSANLSLTHALINTVIMVVLSLVIAGPIGIFSAIYLVEYAKRGNKLVNMVQLTTETLSGIPSIVYGLFGMLCFVTYMKMGYSMVSGALTMAIMILPLIMRTTEEALKSVPDSFREGSFGLGAGKLRTVFKIVLPSAIPGILSGIILAIGRVVGETAALMYTAGTVTNAATNVTTSGRTLAVHMYILSKEGLNIDAAYATAVILLVLVILINMLSNFVAKKLAKS